MHHFNDRTQGVFAEGYKDRNGLPVGDTFAYMLRAKVFGAAARNWSKEQLARFVARFSSDEMAAIMVPLEAAHLRVEFDKSFYGGAYGKVGDFAYVPQALVDTMGGNVHAAFEKMFDIDPIHIVNYCSDERFDADGVPLEECLQDGIPVP